MNNITPENVRSFLSEMEQWSDVLPEFLKASELDRAFHILSEYYRQSKGMKAEALISRINTIYGKGGHRPRDLTAFDKDQKRREAPEMPDIRRHYWTTILRPLLTDAGFIKSLEQTKVQVKEMQHTTEHRDEAIATLKESVVYFDTHFATV